MSSLPPITYSTRLRERINSAASMEQKNTKAKKKKASAPSRSNAPAAANPPASNDNNPPATNGDGGGKADESHQLTESEQCRQDVRELDSEFFHWLLNTPLEKDAGPPLLSEASPIGDICRIIEKAAQRRLDDREQQMSKAWVQKMSLMNELKNRITFVIGNIGQLVRLGDFFFTESLPRRRRRQAKVFSVNLSTGGP